MIHSNDMLQKNLEKSEKSQILSCEFEAEILTLLGEQAEKEERQEVLEKIEQLTKQNQEFQEKIKDLEARKSLALEYLAKYSHP